MIDEAVMKAFNVMNEKYLLKLRYYMREKNKRYKNTQINKSNAISSIGFAKGLSSRLLSRLQSNIKKVRKK